jgi:hypothetical protein
MTSPGHDYNAAMLADRMQSMQQQQGDAAQVGALTVSAPNDL